MNESYPMSSTSESSPSDPLHLGSRLGTLEQEVSGLKTDIGYIRQQIGEISNAFNTFVGQGRTNWTALATWGAVIVTILVAYSKLSTIPYDNYIEAAQKRDSVLEQTYEKHRSLELEEWKLLSLHEEKLASLKEVVQNNHQTALANYKDSVQSFREIQASIFDQTHRWTRQDHVEYSRLIEKQIQSLYDIIVPRRVSNEKPAFCPSEATNK